MAVLGVILIVVPCRVEQMFLSLPAERFRIVCMQDADWYDAIYQTDVEQVIVFGSCGLLQHHHRKDVLYQPRILYNFVSGDTITTHKLSIDAWDVPVGIETPRLVKDKAAVDTVLDKMYGDLVDMESYTVGMVCLDTDKPFSAIRYAIDYCDRPLKPYWGYRGLYRYYQHWRMQRTFAREMRKYVQAER